MRQHRTGRRFRAKYLTLAAMAVGACFQFGCIQAILATIGVTFF